MKRRLLICVFLFLSLRVYSQCTLSVSVTSSSSTVCSENSVSLTATASQGTPPYSYVWNTGQTSASINVNKGGTYTVTVTDKTSGCQPVQQSITITALTTPDPPTAKGATVCANTSATLTATAPGGTYQWYDAATAGNFLASGATYTTQPITANTTFYVQTTIDGCTSTRTPVNVTLPARPAVMGDTVCQGNVATLIARGGDSYQWYDASSGGNLVSTDSMYTTPPLTATKTYYVVVDQNGCASARTPVTATVTSAPPVPTASNVTICYGSTAQLHASAGGTGEFDWYTTPTGGTSLISSPDYTTPPLTASTTYYVQTSLNGCTSTRTPVTVTVDPALPPPAAQTDSICYNSSTTLTAGTTPSDTYNWYDAPTNGNLLATGNTYTTPVLTNSTAYYVQAINGSCTSSRTQINVIVKTQLSAPTASNAIICYGTSATLTAKYQGGVYQWYSAATGGTLLATDTVYTTPVLTSSTTYYVQRTLEGCVSPRTPVKVTVEPTDPAPTVSNTTICSGNSATLTAKSSDNIYAWYNAPSGGTLLSSSQVFVTPALTSTTTYYVQTTSSLGCNSPMTPVTVTVNPTPAQPTANGATICPGTSATLTASTASGTIQWYNASSGGTLLKTGTSYTTPVLNSPTTYYVQSTNGSCTSSRVAVTVSIIAPASPEFQYSSGSYCASGPNATPVINNPTGGTFTSSPAGLVFVSNTTGEINVSASTPGTYKVSFTNNAPCPGTTSTTVSIVTTFNSTISYNTPFCQGGPNPSPIYSGHATAGTFTATPSGLVFINTSTGEIDLSQTAPGTYTITNTLSSPTCGSSSSSTSVTIYPKVIVNAGPNQTVPTGSTVQLAGSISGGATTGTWSGGTGTFSNTSDPDATYTPGPGETSAVLKLTSSDPAGPCGAQSSTVTIIFRAQPAAPTAASVTICSGNTANLSATAPGGTYQWYDAATGGNLLYTGPAYTTPALTVNTNYYVQTIVNGVSSNRTEVTVTVTSANSAPTVSGNMAICQGTTTTLTASGSAGTYRWYDAATGGTLLSTSSTYTTPTLNSNTTYYVQAVAGQCSSPRQQVNISVTTLPNVTSAATAFICSGNPLNYTITADQPSAQFTWSRAQVAGISNPAVSGQTSSTITETLINTTVNPVKVTYSITPAIGSCTGPVFNYVVTVYPSPQVTSAASTTVCDDTPIDYTVTFNDPSTTFSWSRAAVNGLSNAGVSGQTAGTIKEVLHNTTNAPVQATYVFTYQNSSCSGTPFNYTVTVNPTDTINSSTTGTACSGVPQDYVITSSISTTTYSWSRAAVTGISNPPANNQTSSTITETLVNTTTEPLNVVYMITAMANGCASTPFKYLVRVNPPIPVPVVKSNSPVCTGSTLSVATTDVIGATYQWTKPDGSIEVTPTPILNIDNATTANSGTYTLVETLHGCQSQPVSINASVDGLAVANAGSDVTVCKFTPAVQLDGTVTGGSATGNWSGGSGTFSPSSTDLHAVYTPSAADIQQGSVTLTLTTTSEDGCPSSSSSMTITYGPAPGVNAGPDLTVCSQDASIPVSGKLLTTGTVTWLTLGSGTFSNPNSLNTNYMPSKADVAAGSVQLVLQLNGNDECYFKTDTMVIHFVPPATVYAGGTRYVLKGYTITLTPTVNEDSLKYLWSPDIDINNDTLKNPTVTGDISRTYTVTVTDPRGCTSSDTVYVEVSPTIVIDNTFTPNGDGINDTWNITGLIAYVNATVDIYNRYGQPLFHSKGYPVPWDGTYDGKPLPVGVYYYVIRLNYQNIVLSGPVTILR
jgi:large repetitive protein